MTSKLGKRSGHDHPSGLLEWQQQRPQRSPHTAPVCWQARSLLAPYLPPRSSSSPFSEGGALYALGLIHANHGKPIIPFLLESLEGTGNEVLLLLISAS